MISTIETRANNPYYTVQNLVIMTSFQEDKQIKILAYKTIPASFTCAKLFQHEGRQELRNIKRSIALTKIL
jgi:hypothetical protein